MEDMFVKPGNQERGWNDPPQFSYGLQASHSNKRHLGKRAPVPQYTAGPGAPPPAASPPPSSTPPSLPLSGLTPPPRTTFPSAIIPPPPLGMATPPQRQPMIHQEVPDAGGSQWEGEPDVESVVSALGEALTTCRRSVKKQVCDDVEKRLRLLEESWRAGRLSLAVQRRMDALTREMKGSRWDTADEIHRALMVDHVAEVSQWMVGVKRLIAETRNLSIPELLEPPESCELQRNAEEEPLDENVGPRNPEPLESSGEFQRNAEEEPLEEDVDRKQEDQDVVDMFPSTDRTLNSNLS